MYNIVYVYYSVPISFRLVVMPIVFRTVQTWENQRLMGHSFFSAARNVVRFYPEVTPTSECLHKRKPLCILLTPLEPQSRLGDKLLEFESFVPKTGLRF